MSPFSAVAVFALAAAVTPNTWGGLPDPQSCEPQQIAKSGARMIDVAIRGDHAYVTGDYGGLLIYDISDPAAPKQVKRVSDLVPVYVDIEGDRGVIFEPYGDRLRLFTINDPLTLEFGATLPFVSSLHIAYDFAGDVLIMGESGRLSAYDISDFSNPVLLTQTFDVLMSLESARDIVIDDDRVAIALGPLNVSPNAVRGVRFADFKNPAAPTPGALFTVPNFNGALAYSDGLCVLTRAAAKGFELVVLDASDVHNPVVLGTAPSPEAADIQIAGDIVHVASRSGNVSYATFSIADPGSPTPLGSFVLVPGSSLEIANRVQAIALTDAAAFVVFAQSAFGVMEISDPTSLDLMAHTFNADGAKAVAAVGDVAFVADWGELRAIDLSDPAHPVGVFRDPLSYGARSISIDGDLLAVACEDRGTIVYDITDPRAPQKLATILPLLSPQDNAIAVEIQDDRLYIVEDRTTKIVRIVDIADPAAPVQLGLLSENEIEMSRLSFSGEFAFLTSPEGVNVWDLRAPDEPLLVQTLPRTLIFDLDTDGPIMALTRFVGVGSPRPAVVELFDISDPAKPVSLSETPHSYPWSPTSALSRDRLVMLSTDEAVYDITDPRTPRLISSNINPTTEGTLYSRQGAFSEGGLLLLGTQDYLYIFDLSPCILGCVADADDSGLVDMADLNLVLSAFNAFPADPNWIAEADLDSDGQVTFADLNLVVASLHTDCDPAP